MAARFKRAGRVAALGLAFGAAALPAHGARAASNPCQGQAIELGAEQGPVELPGALESAVTANYSVLRRAQSPSDLPPPVNTAGDTVQGSLSGYYAAEIRQLAALPDGARFFLVPGLPHVLELPPLQCVPKSVRKRLIAFRQTEEKRASEPAYCVVSSGLRSALFGGGDCGSFAEIAASKPLFAVGFRALPVALLVPDGVAAVRVTGPGGASVTLPVSDNAYVYEPTPQVAALRLRLFKRLFDTNAPKHATRAEKRRVAQREAAVVRELAARTVPAKVEWLTAAGAVTKTVMRPRRHGPVGAGFFGEILSG